MDAQQHLSIRLAADDTIALRTTVGENTHDLVLDRGEFEQLFHSLIRLRAKLDLRDAREVIEDPSRFGRQG